MAPLEGAVLPQGSLILVTGANGLVGSHVADQFLKHGYNVRGTVRDAKKSAWVARYFETQYGTERFELVELQDLTNTEAVKKVAEGESNISQDSQNSNMQEATSFVPTESYYLSLT